MFSKMGKVRTYSHFHYTMKKPYTYIYLLQGEYRDELWTDSLLVLTVYKPNMGFDLFMIALVK